MKFDPSSSGFTVGPTHFSDPCLGAIFLSPSHALPNFVGVLAGTDSCGIDFTSHNPSFTFHAPGLGVALRWVPQRSGVVVPDYLVADSTFRGAASVRAAGLIDFILALCILTSDIGFWDNNWQFSYANGYA